MNYRHLTSAEQISLQSQGCTAEDWGGILVSADFTTENIWRVGFCASRGNHHAQGLQVEVLDETGSLPVAIHDRLTYRDALVAVGMDKQHAISAVPDYNLSGIVLEGQIVLRDVRALTDVHVHAGANIIGATRLTDCSIYGSVGDNVILEHVIVLDHSHVYDGVCMDHCFVGQGCHIGRMYSATQSLFFANCHFENGEACAYLAGPYSVSHHKATLMIACHTSFFNAGSGSNQSNHSYKMGPNKYGLLARGAKLGSSSYLYWPAKVGEFSTVIGHHFTHFDLLDLPFTLIVEDEGKTHLIPGQILGSCGLRRDVAKWPKRDNRGEDKLDEIDFSLFQSQTVASIQSGLSILRDMKAQGLNEYQGCIISNRSIDKGIAWYELALRVAHGDAAAQAEWDALLDADAQRDMNAFEAQKF